MVDTEPDASPTWMELWGGVGVIGGSKVLIGTDRARVLCDLGVDIPDGADLFRAPVRPRPDHQLVDALRMGAAPVVPGLYRPEALLTAGPPDPVLAGLRQAPTVPTAVCVSHGHIDHDGMIGFVRPDVPVYAHPDTLALHHALRRSGLGPVGPAPDWRALSPGRPLEWEDLRVEAVPVTHELPGACALLLTTPSGTVAYTGDLNFHRDGAPESWAFLQKMRGVDVLVAETTMLSFDQPVAEPPGEAALIESFAERCRATAGLVLANFYERDVVRCQRAIDAAQAAGRRMVWPGQQAAVLAHLGVGGVVSWDATRPQRQVHAHAAAGVEMARVSVDEVHADPSGFVVQPDPHDAPALLDLPPAPVWVHAQGEPLGPFVPEWATWTDWMAALGTEVVRLSSTGHATPGDLRHMMASVQPKVLVPMHGFHPERLTNPFGAVLLPERGRRYRIADLLPG